MVREVCTHSTIVALLLAAASAPAQPLQFTVASVKPGKPEAPPFTKLETNRFTGNLTLFGYIVFAWNLMPSREQADSMLAHAPKWVSADNFEIHAVAEGNPTKDQIRLMLRSLLADRFQLQVHTVTPLTSVIALTLDKPGATGPQLRPHAEGQPCDVSPTAAVAPFPPACDELQAIPARDGAIRMAARDISMERLATSISSLGILAGPVVDQTGLTGHFDFMIEFTPQRRNPPDDSPGTTLQEVLHDQLGLKLKSTKAPLETLLIDRAERPSEN